VIAVEPACCRKKGLTAVLLQLYSIHHPQSEAASLSVCSDVHIASDCSGQGVEKRRMATLTCGEHEGGSEGPFN
jgi:hypothetical protein